MTWIVLGIPSLTSWRDSIVWVVIMSWWANVAGHWAGEDAAVASWEAAASAAAVAKDLAHKEAGETPSDADTSP